MITHHGRRRGHGLRKSDAKSDIWWMLDHEPVDGNRPESGRKSTTDVEAQSADGPKRGPSVVVSLAIIAVSIYVFLQVWAVVLEMQR